jgi:hypothetical protein
MEDPCMRLVAPLALAAALAPVFAVALAPPQQKGRPGPAGSFGEEPLWDDGKAEITQYDAEEIVEGEKRQFTAWTIVVAELLDPRQMVKKEKFDLGYVPVLKCNWFLDIPTGLYRYHQMASLFLRRSDMLVMKAAFSSQEWCGTTHQEWRRDRPGLEVRSYWDGEADRTYELGPLSEDVLFDEQVPLWVRAHRPADAREEKITLIGRRLGTSKCPPPVLTPARLVFRGAAAPAGGGEAPPLEVDLLREGKTDVLLLGARLPYPLLEWRRADGTTWKLRKTRRIDYWNFSKNQFEAEWDKL